jgi:hypothetical protein
MGALSGSSQQGASFTRGLARAATVTVNLT